MLDDRLYDFVERRKEQGGGGCIGAVGYYGHYLSACVKVSQLLDAFTDPVLELQRLTMQDGEEELTFPEPGTKCKYVNKDVSESNTKSALCSTLKQLLLPSDNVDSKTWVVPLMLRAAPQLESLGDCLAHEGIRLARDLGLEARLPSPTKLQELSINLEDFSLSRLREKTCRRLKSLLSRHAYWSIFSATHPAAALGNFSLKRWAESDLRQEALDASDSASIRTRWKYDIGDVASSCPDLRTLNISVQPSVLLRSDADDLWAPLGRLQHLSELHAHSSSWADILGLLRVVGRKLTMLSLMLSNSASSSSPLSSVATEGEGGIGDDPSETEFVNAVPFLCPELEELRLGFLHRGESPHSVCPDPRFDLDSSYSSLTVFEAAGNISLEALSFLWARAKKLRRLKVTGKIVSSSSSSSSEVVLTTERLVSLFGSNEMRHLRELDVDMTLSCITAAQTLLALLPAQMASVATLNIKVSIPESLEGENFGTLVSSVLERMASFKSQCQMRRGTEVVWNWRREGILTILLQQQMLLTFSDLIDP